MNRAFVIAALRTGPTVIHGRSRADDVERMVACMRTLGVSIVEIADGWRVTPRDVQSADSRASLELDCGLGGTTFRFMLALAALRPGRTRLRIGKQLAARPHDALVNALTTAGARIDATEEGYEVHGWSRVPNSFEIDVSVSSQFASALAMLSLVCDGPFTLRLTGKAVSMDYLDMTVSMLKQAGMECIQSDEMLAFNPSPRTGEPLDFAIPADAGIEAVWKTAARLCVPVEIASSGIPVRHPDRMVDDMLDAILNENDRNEIELDCTRCPDLVPLLTAAALRSDRPVRFTGIAHLRYKESDRLEGLAASLRSVGIQVETGPGWMRIPRQKPGPVNDVRRFETHDDHRMVFTGLLLSVLLGPLVINSPWSVTKSYPGFWTDARMAGWTVTPDG
jgi:3-phosphoshikimate 1-carboxyvinyltransferase